MMVGALAAFFVLFVPMGLAGWHLSRNKVLFFSGALFISLAIAVHLTPYFPSISRLLVPLPSSSPPVLSPISCLSSIHDVFWSSHDPPSWSWSRSNPALSCGFQKLTRSDASDLLNGSRIIVAGDSQARLLALSVLSLILDHTAMDTVRADLFKRHSDYHISVPENGADLDFVWAPYESNLTETLRRIEVNERYPDVVVMGDGLWHMLHFTSALDYGVALRDVRRSATGTGRSRHMFWLGMPTLVSAKLNTEEKRMRMNMSIWASYEQEVNSSGLLRQFGGPFLLLDVGLLSRGCGSRCTVDGMHYDEVVYEAALHIMLNALLIESHQRI
ncbi:uncharacterized protein LOC120275468 [Dioscorea cayenensis subsp. rotundata]|uniref:Uncharacterized protein LOC120275468 n=1 Tax=Dioscorea cayennensis subsp. rotundata TaxID=55577 RepID=A0AB40CDL5_DIOCR|nr:uncharacterized protein LOC120275468 [Dioscorea cayenensis subsp. rotundata]